MSFGRFPSQWVKSNGLDAFSASLRAGRRSGEYIAALKLYLVAAAYSDFGSWTSTLSLSQLEDVTGLSRPMLIKGGEILREQELIIKDVSRKTSTYTLISGRHEREVINFLPAEERPTTWAKVPQDIISQSLRDIPNRGRIPLAALRIYVLLLTMRNNVTDVANIRYAAISDYTGVRRADIRKSLNILVISDFIVVVPHRYGDERVSTYPYNVYMLRGDFGGKMRGRMRPRMSRDIPDI